MWLWEKEGHQGKDWKAAAVSAPEMTEPYTVSFDRVVSQTIPFIGTCKHRFFRPYFLDFCGGFHLFFEIAITSRNIFGHTSRIIGFRNIKMREFKYKQCIQ